MPRRTAYLIPLIVGLSLVLGLLIELRAEEERHAQQARLDVFYKLATVQGRLEDGLNSRLQLAGAIRSFVSLNPEINQQDFEALTESLYGALSGIRSVRLARKNRVSHVYPSKGLDRELGRKLLRDYPLPIRNLVSQAMQSREGRITLPFDFDSDMPVISAGTPVFIEGKAGQRRYWGLVLVNIYAESLYREAGLRVGAQSLDMALMATELAGPERVLFGDEAVFDMEPVTMNVRVPDGFWQMAAVPQGGWSESPNRNLLLFGGIASILAVTGLLLATVYFLLGGIKEREKYRHLVQNAKSIILRIDMDGYISFSNEYADRFFGYEVGELLGRPMVGTLMPEKSLEGKSMKRFINRLLLDPTAYLFNEILNTRKNGEMVWVAWANEPVLGRDGNIDEILCVGTDVTDRKIMEEALKQSERQYRVLAENVTDIIIGLDAGNNITYISPSDEVLRGFGRHDVLGRPVKTFLTPQSYRVFEESVDRLLSRLGSEGKPPSTIMDLEFYCSDESTVWLETRLGLLLNEKRELIGLQGVGRDISDRKRANALREDMERMTRHDLKTPLGAVIGLPEEIRRLGNMSPSQTEMLGTIERAGDSMLELINRSLDMFKMESGTYDLRRSQTNALAVLEEIKGETRTVIRGKGISIGVQVKNGDANAFWVMAEEPLFKSMLSNLMLNALEASPAGGTVTVVLEKGKNVSIAIRNKGAVPESLREVFFDRYASSNKSGGSGLGTYSARLIARTHGGDISVDTSIPDETCVTVVLPG